MYKNYDNIILNVLFICSIFFIFSPMDNISSNEINNNILKVDMSQDTKIFLNNKVNIDSLEFKKISLSAENIKIQSYNPFHKFGPFWFVTNPYELELILEIDEGEINLLVNRESILVEPRVYIYLRGFIGYGSFSGSQGSAPTGNKVVGLCTEVILIPYSYTYDTIFEKQQLFSITELEDLGQTAYVTTADFNNDGYIDIAASGATSPFEYSQISLFINKEGTDFERYDVFTFSDSYISDLDSGDYDNDGDIDLIYTFSESTETEKINGTGMILWNNGENQFIEESLLFCNGAGSVDEKNRINPKISSADYDNDGDIDVVVGDNSGMIEFYQNNGAGVFSSIGIIQDFGHGSWGISSDDFDNDGDVDFLVSAATSKTSFQGYVYLVENNFIETNGSIIFMDDSGISLFSYSAPTCGLQLIDYDHDGDLDIIIGFSRDLYLYINQNNSFDIYYLGALPVNKEGYDDSLYRGGLSTADFNNDGKEDIVMGGIQAVIRICLNDYGPLPPLLPDFKQLSTAGRYSIKSDDINNDDIYYFVDWGDGTDTGWIGPYQSGENVHVENPEVSIRAYYIKVKAKDENGMETDWKDYIDIIYPDDI